MAEPEIVEDFYGVYLLYNINPKYKGRTYVGYTRDPNRRIMQHNRGTWAGGAHRTSNRGPWKMVLIVHGFPNNISALRFEWAWQNPSKTTRLQHLNLKKIPRKETEFQFKLRVLSEMLRVGPWNRLPLMIRWLENEYRVEFPPERKPPDHMPVIQGPVKSYNHKKLTNITSIPTIECLLCSGYLKETEKLSCMNVNCDLVSHINCLANLFLSPGEYVPIHGTCPFCNTKLKWGDLIRRMNGYDLGVKGDQTGDGDEVGEEIYTQNKGFENVDDDADVVCTQDELINNYDNAENLVVTQNRMFIDNFDDDDDDIVCTQDFGEKNEDISTQDGKFENFDDDDDLVCTQNNVLNNYIDNQETDNVICTQNEIKIFSKNDDPEDSDDDVLFKCDKVYDDQPSWFLDCHENL
ncbi:structure-specific endonuclease subunit SLX1 homolog [Pararge aegeria]|uniref:structure-specific endonuclease subunit SLX1 homolog n=1 Tax=Pararge aegeria TaxID=116150 RepID=UPI0019CF6D98|nr:structure-specific endonuclease subunit SLX1 homolog [Pararge aegeria]